MKVIIYSKEGCQYCDHAVTLSEAEGLEYEKILIEKEELKKLCGGSIDSYPQIFIDGRHIGNYFEYQFTVFPLKYPELWELYKKAQMSNWTAEEVDLSSDMEDWKNLNDNEKKFIKYILAFFAGSDGIVFENINNNFADEVYSKKGQLGPKMVRYQVPNLRRAPLRICLCRGNLLFWEFLCHLLAQETGPDARPVLLE